MKKTLPVLPSFRLFAWFFAMFGLLSVSGCASFYLDNATREVPVSEFKKPGTPRPVQVIFEFQTKGVANGRATDYFAPQVFDQIKESGLFSSVDKSPVEGGALLNVVINNVPLTDDAFSKGVATGLTFGLVGSQVSDGYVCTMKYLSGSQAPLITTSARHAIHTTMGAKGDPENGTKMESLEVAAKTMSRQIISTTLNQLSREEGFR